MRVNRVCKNIKLNSITQPKNGIPFFVDKEYWASAKGAAVLCGYDNKRGELVITAYNLMPLGLYTAWFITESGSYPAAPKNVTFTEDGFDPNRLIVNSKGQLQYYIAHLDFNPFDGFPTNSKTSKITGIVLALHLDNRTNGIKPGPHVPHLSGSI